MQTELTKEDNDILARLPLAFDAIYMGGDRVDAELMRILAIEKDNIGDYLLLDGGNSLCQSRKRQAGVANWKALALVLALFLGGIVLFAHCSKAQSEILFPGIVHKIASNTGLKAYVGVFLPLLRKDRFVVTSAVDKYSFLSRNEIIHISLINEPLNSFAGCIRQEWGSLVGGWPWREMWHRRALSWHDTSGALEIASKRWRAPGVLPYESERSSVTNRYTVDETIRLLIRNDADTSHPGTFRHFVGVGGNLGGSRRFVSNNPQKYCANSQNPVKQYKQKIEPERDPSFRRLIFAIFSVLGCFVLTFLGAKDIYNQRRIRGAAIVLCGFLLILFGLGLAVFSAFRWTWGWLL